MVSYLGTYLLSCITSISTLKEQSKISKMQVGIESTGTYSVLVCELGKYQLNVLNVKITMYIFFSK